MKYRYLLLSVVLSTVALGQSARTHSRSRSSAKPATPAASPRAARAEIANRPPATYADYHLLLERNIFNRNRAAWRPGGPTTGPTTSSIQPALVLTGMLQQGDQYVAFVEDRRSNTTTQYKLGQSIGDGRITEAGLDFIQLTTPSGRQLRVDVGSPLDTGPTMTVAGGTTAPSAGSSFGPPSGSDASTNDILEKLRQRRLQETKK